MLIVFLSQKTEYVPLWYKHINNGAFHITNIIINVMVKFDRPGECSPEKDCCR